MPKRNQITRIFLFFAALQILATAGLLAQTTGSFVVAAYNIENWVLMDRRGAPNQPKPQAEKRAVFDVLQVVRPDVLGLVELGSKTELAEVIDGLRQRGLDYPFNEWIQGGDSTRHVALLSRFPIAERFSRTDYSSQMDGQSMRINRGILDVLVQVNDRYAFRAIVVHLKSKVPSRIGDQAVMRLEEARLLRSHLDTALKQNPRCNLFAMGDYNDTPESEPISVIVGSEGFRLFDLMPVDSRGGHDTHYWKARDMFSRIDYLLVSPGMSNEYIEGSARIADVPGWDTASDHRAIYASFHDRELGEAAGKWSEPQSVG
ncbi:MAG: endonuclease/exonuclease/phosphatase family protein, partial [Gammaproteobacteria bacterium]